MVGSTTIIFVTFGDQSISVDTQLNSEALTKAQGLLRESKQALTREDFKMVNPLPSFSDPIANPNYKDSLTVTNVDDFYKTNHFSLI